jgi:hypothetical protein
MSPMGLILIGLIVILTLLLFIPSAKGNRISKAKAYLAREFPIVSKESIKPLTSAYLVSDDKFVNFTSSPKFAILIFPPNPTSYSPITMIDETIDRLNLRQLTFGETPVGMLLAPEPTAPGWTIFAKVYLAKVLMKQQVQDLKELGLELPSNPKAVTRLKAIWKKVPTHIQSKSNAILDYNVRLGRRFKTVRRYCLHGALYSIGDEHLLFDFNSAYDEAYPEEVRTERQ